jgi:hypothetical protein
MLLEPKPPQANTASPRELHPIETQNSTLKTVTGEPTPESLKICAQILEQVVSDVLSLDDCKNAVYLFADSPEVLETINTKIMSGLSSLETIDVYNFPNNASLTPTHTHRLRQLKVVQQIVYNLCGYHAIFSLIQFASYIKTGDFYFLERMLDKKVFYQFHTLTKKFLHVYAKNTLQNQATYPWDYKSIEFGDYERTYNDVLHLHHGLYLDVFQDETNCLLKYRTLEFQFGRFVTSTEELTQFQFEINEFLEQKLKPGQRSGFYLQLGVTNHWLAFIVIKYSDQIEFFLLDSQNRLNFNKTDAEIENYIKIRAVERVEKEGKKKWDRWQVTVNTQALKDRNLLCDLLTKSFCGGFSIFGY